MKKMVEYTKKYKMRKTVLLLQLKKIFSFRKFCLFIRASIGNFSLSHMCLKSSSNRKNQQSFCILGKVFHYMLDEKSSLYTRDFLFYVLISHHPTQSIRDLFYFMASSAVMQKCGKKLFQRNKINFSDLGLEADPGSFQVL